MFLGCTTHNLSPTPILSGTSRLHKLSNRSSRAPSDTHLPGNTSTRQARLSFPSETDTCRCRKAGTCFRSPSLIRSGTCLPRTPCSCLQTQTPAPSHTCLASRAGTLPHKSPQPPARTAPPRTACSRPEPSCPDPSGRCLPGTPSTCSPPKPPSSFGTFPPRTSRIVPRQTLSDTVLGCKGDSRRNSACQPQSDTCLLGKVSNSIPLSCLLLFGIFLVNTACNFDVLACRCLFDILQLDTLYN